MIRALGIALTCLALTGCFREHRAEQQLDDTSWLRFPRLEMPVEVELVGQDGALVTFPVEPDESARYAIPGGTWRVVVRREGAVLMDRNLFINEGESRSFDVR